MKKYFKNVENDYLVSISTGAGAEEITKEEYENIKSVIHNRPTPEAGYDYRLRTDLTWELIDIEIIPEDEMEISNQEFMDMIGEVL